MISASPPETRAYLGVCAAASLIALAGVGAPPREVQIALLAFGVLVFGLPHGALDPLIARRAGLAPGRSGVIAFHLAYGAAALGVLGVWLIAPVAALIGFLIYSAYHFAGDWVRGLSARLILGAAILSLPAAAHPGEVGALYAILSGAPAERVAALQHQLAVVWIIILALACVHLARQGRISAVLELIALGLTAAILPPLIFFALYFCVLHSPRHFLKIWRRFPDKTTPGTVAAFYTALAAAAAIAAAFMLRPATLEIDALAVQTVFMALAALTAPHLIVSSLCDARDRPRACATSS